MLVALLLSGALLSSVEGVKPPDYTEKGLCDLWAGAQCQLAKCGDNGDARCTSESRKCRGMSRTKVSQDRAAKVAACAKALLKLQCGAPKPTECDGVDGP